MSTEALAKAKAGPRAVDPKAVRDTPGQHPLVSALVSGVGLWLAFPPAGYGWLAWVALYPLFSLVRSPRSRASLYFGAWAGGMVFWLLSIQWIRLTDADAWLAWWVMALALSFWWPGFLALARLAVLRLRLPIMAAAPVLWVGLEYARAHILSGFPWYYLAHSQHDYLPLIQIADVSGALGLSFLIAMANAWLVDLRSLPLLRATPQGPRLTRPHFLRISILAAALAATVGYGAFRLGTARFQDGPRLALLQSDLPQDRKRSEKKATLLELYRTLVGRALALKGPERPDLIVWPETSYPDWYVIRDPKLGDAAFEDLARRFDPERPNPGAFWTDWSRAVAKNLHDWVDHIQVPMVIGVVAYDFNPGGLSKYNSAILCEPKVPTIQRYAKVHLVPFGEYVPFIEALPWLIRLTPYHGGTVPSLTFGRGHSWFTLGHYRFATAICFEDTVPQAVRGFFRAPKDGRQPDFLINMSNDGWFRGSSELDMHLAISVFRAVENRVPLARAVNTGMSAFIDGNGKVVSSLPKNTMDVLSGTVLLDDRVSLYSAWGDWLGASCLALTAALIPWPLVTTVVARRPKDVAVIDAGGIG